MSRSIWTWAVAITVGAAVLVKLGDRWTAPPTVTREAGLNVLLVTIDTLRADAVGAYGQPGNITPSIDRLAAAGVRFAEARAHNVITLASHANILSGRLPFDHGVRDNAGFRFPEGVETLATLLKARGYRTAAFVSAFPLESRFGLARGFDVYDDQFADAGARPAFLVQERRGSDTVARARQWLDSATGGPWFCWVHLYEPHFPYEPGASLTARFPGNPYHGEVAAADAALAPLLDPIVAAGREGRTLVVLTADHGEALGDHGEATHGVFAYEAGLKVPLVAFQPRLFRPTVVTAPVGHVDVMPTVLDALALSVPDGLPGQSLLTIMTGNRDDNPPPTYFEALSASLNRRWAPLVGVIDGHTKYIDLPIPELYDLDADQREEHNLADMQPQRLEEMRRLLAGIREADTGVRREVESAETRDRLRSLGYVTGTTTSPRVRATEDDDPKRLIGLDTLLQEVVSLSLEGDLQRALATCRDLVRRRPDAPLSLLHLALVERDAGNLPAAIDALRSVIALDPENDEAVPLLGAVLTQAGRVREAADFLEPYAKRPNAVPETFTARAIALAKLGRSSDALATLDEARQRDPSNPMTLVEAGTVHLMTGDRDRARRAFEQALTINANVARAHSSLGVLALEDGRTDDALGHWRAATSLDPREYEKILALGIAFDRAGRATHARACLQFFVESAPPGRYQQEIERARLWLNRSE